MSQITPTYFSANQATSRKFRVTGEQYLDHGRVGVAGNDFGTHITLHFADGSYANFKTDALEELVWHDTCHEHPDAFSAIDVLDSGLRYSAGYLVRGTALYQGGRHVGYLATCRKWRYAV